MDIINLEEKRNKLLDKYRNLFIQNTGFTGNMLNSYVDNLITVGEQQYGDNFTEDILKEKRDDSILWLMNEVSKHGGISFNNIHNKVKETMQETVNAVSAIANQKAIQEQVSENDQILEIIDKMNEYEFEKYLSELSWSSSNRAKFNGIVSYKLKQEPNASELEISKEVLKSMADEIELIFPKDDISKQENISNDDVLNGYVMAEKSINNNEGVTDEDKKVWRDALWKDFDNYVEQNPEDNKIDSHDISKQITEPIELKLPEEQKTDSIAKENTLKMGNTVIPATAKLGKRKEAPQTLKQKFKEKWKNASFKKKLLIGAVAIGAIIGLGVIAATAISQMVATQSFDANSIMATNNIASSLTNGLDLGSIDSSVVDFSSIGQGTEVHTTLNEALTDTNTLTSNEWMNVDHMEAVSTTGEVVNLDGMTVDQVNQTLDSGDYGVRGSLNGEYQGWFSEETVKDAINQGKGL